MSLADEYLKLREERGDKVAREERWRDRRASRKPRNRGKQDVTPASWEYASPAGLQEDATPDEPYVGPSAQQIGARSPPAPPSASEAPAPRRLGAPVRDDSWLPQDWQGMAPEANDPLTAIRARTAQIDAGRQSDRPAWEAAAGRVLPEETQPAAGAPFQTYYDSHLPLIIEGPRRLAEEAISLGADSLTWPIDQGARDRMDNRAEFLGRFARGLGDAAHDLGNTVDNWSIDEDTSIAGRERQAAEQERNFQRNIRLNDYVEQIRRPERYLGTSEVLNVTVPGPSMGERVGRFVDDTVGYGATEDFLRAEAQYQAADFLADVARERENARRLGVAPENMPDTSMAPLPSDQYESQAEAASVPVGLTIGLSALEFVPGVGLVPDLVAAGRATARGVGRNAWRLGQRVGVLDATDELPYAFVAREGAEDAPGLLTRQYRDRVRNPVLAAGVTGAGVEAADGNFGDDPLASTIAALSAAALTRRLGATAAEAGAERVVANRLREGSGVEPSNADFFPTSEPAEMSVREYRPAENTVVRVEPDGRVVMTYQGAYQSGASDARAAGSGAEAVRTWRATLRALEDDIAATQRPEYHWTPGPDGTPDERLAQFYREAMSRRAPEGYVFSETPDGVMHLTRERPVRFGEELDMRTGEIRPASPIDPEAPDLRLADDLGWGNYPRRDPGVQSEGGGIPPQRRLGQQAPDAGAGSVEQRPQSAAEHARMMAEAKRRLAALEDGVRQVQAEQTDFSNTVDAMRRDARDGAEARAARFAEAERILREAGALPDVPDGRSAQTGSATRVYHATNREGFDVPTRDRTRRGEGISVSTNRDVAAEYGDRVIDLDLRGNYPDIASAEMEAVQRQWAATRAETGRTFEEELLAQGFDGYRDGDTIFVSRDNMLSRAQPNASSAPELPTRGSSRRLGDDAGNPPRQDPPVEAAPRANVPQATQRRWQAAVRDPETGQVYTGLDHLEAIDSAGTFRLSAEQRAVLSPDQGYVIERRMAGLSNREIADEMNTSANTVAVHYANARKRLAQNNFNLDLPAPRMGRPPDGRTQRVGELRDQGLERSDIMERLGLTNTEYTSRRNMAFRAKRKKPGDDTLAALALATGATGAGIALSDNASAEDGDVYDAIDRYGASNGYDDPNRWQIVPPRGESIPSVNGMRVVSVDGEYAVLEGDGRVFRAHVMRGFDQDANQPSLSLNIVGELVPVQEPQVSRRLGQRESAQGETDPWPLVRPIASTAVGAAVGFRLRHPTAGALTAGASAAGIDVIAGGREGEPIIAGSAAAGLRGLAPQIADSVAAEAAARGPEFEARRRAFAMTLPEERPELRGTQVRGDEYLGTSGSIETDQMIEQPWQEPAAARIIVPGQEMAEQGYSRRLGVNASPREQFEALSPTGQLRWMNEAERKMAEREARLVERLPPQRRLGGPETPAQALPRSENAFPIGFYDPATGQPLFGSSGRQPPPRRERLPIDQLKSPGGRIGSTAAERVAAARDLGVVAEGEQVTGAEAVKRIMERARSDSAFLAMLRERYPAIAMALLGGAAGSEIISQQRRLGQNQEAMAR